MFTLACSLEVSYMLRSLFEGISYRATFHGLLSGSLFRMSLLRKRLDILGSLDAHPSSIHLYVYIYIYITYTHTQHVRKESCTVACRCAMPARMYLYKYVCWRVRVCVCVSACACLRVHVSVYMCVMRACMQMYTRRSRHIVTAKVEQESIIAYPFPIAE